MDIITLALAKKSSKSYVDNKLDAITTNMDYKGSVSSVEDLPSTATAGDIYTVSGYRYLYNGTEWEKLESIPKGYTELSESFNDLVDGVAIAEEGTKVIHPTVTLESGYVLLDGTVLSSETYQHTSSFSVRENDVLKLGNSENMRFITAYSSGVAQQSLGNQNVATYTVPSGVDNIVLSYLISLGTQEISITRNGITYRVNTDSFLPISISDTDFLTVRTGNNLVNPDIAVTGSWYEENASNVRFQTNQYTTSYTAVIIPVEGLSEITVFCSLANARYYSWFATTEIPPEDGQRISFISWSGYGYVTLDTPRTITIPEGAKYILMSVQNINSNVGALMANEGSTALPYEPYSETYLLNGKELLFTTESKPTLKVPSSYSLVVGDTFQLFFKGIVDAVKADDLCVEVDCSKGNLYERYYEFTPSTAETLTARITLYDNAHNQLDEKEVSLIVSAKATSPSSQVNVLCVGDSLTQGVWTKELYRRLTASDGTPTGDGLSNINFIGTREYDGVHFEGYGGWRFNSYNTQNVSDNSKLITCSHDKTSNDQHSIYQASNGSQWKLETIESGQIKILLVSGTADSFPSTGTLTWVSGGVKHSDIVYTASQNTAGNPFWNASTGQVDFANYATNQGVSSIDYVYVLLGWNDAGSTEANYKASAQTFIDNVHASFPNAKIILMGLEIPARNGLGRNYGATGIYSKYYGLMQFVFNLDQWYEDLVASNTNVYHFSLAGQFDTEYNMLTIEVPVNTRNSTMIQMQSNGVHPANSGQYQIADATYRDFTARL